jgi:4a-hydroxytetrahydrobiopterin dehydratase
MAKREKLTDEAIAVFTREHAGWERTREGEALAKTFAFDDYAAGMAFAVRVGFAAEKRDHHPDLGVMWRKVRVEWSTHDAGGITAVDTEMATLCDGLHPA